MWTLWRSVKALPPEDQPAKRQKAVDVYAYSFFKYLRAVGFNSQDILRLLDRLMGKVVEQMQKDRLRSSQGKPGP
ncbi:hypothetical protein H6761_00475 [Candidatus Nomurabacteria bacterium]|nr:hypothetical protein [Candidatus Nomurabacteria bacterium]